jgi:sedoheptulokinase
LGSYLGLDVGTTTVTAIVVNSETGDVLSRATEPNDSEITSGQDKKLGRSEWDAGRVLEIVRVVLRQVTESGREVGAVRPIDTIGPIGAIEPIRGIGVTGQMHGMLLVDDAVQPVGPFIGWQDQRASDARANASGTVISDLLETVESVDVEGHVCRPKTGYLGATLAWLDTHNKLPTDSFLATFLPDFVAARLTDSKPVTDATNAAGSGLFDVATRSWHQLFVDRLGLSPDLLPAVVESGSQAGQLSPQWKDTGLGSGMPVCVASGDNQASFLGSVREPDETVLVNVGTGGQVSVSASTPDAGPGLEARPHVDGRYILVGAGRVGGRTYAWLRDFYLGVGRQIFNTDGDPESIYERMTDLAGKAGPGAGGLTFDPLLTGTREDPERRGVMEGIGTSNFDPGHLSRALLEGVIAQFRLLYENAVAVGVGERSVLIGAGNGLRKNPVLREIAEQKFRLKMRVPRHTEEAAYGAAMQAMVLGGDRASLEDAAGIIRYE